MGEMADYIIEQGYPDESSYDKINLDYVWESNTGDVHISNMTTNHLINTIKYLERMYQARHEEDWKNYLPNIYYNMCNEKLRREKEEETK
jgi:hypothetical protein